ncbi:hypothetical protein HK101_005499 [Irineochytrium annulatum]|nr:hypothetical protein HK101_005499 [Irineochytrium annulatum]
MSTSTDLLGFAGSHVGITGASGGVGVPTARAFLEAGAVVSLQYNLQRSNLKSLLDEFPDRVIAISCDVTNEEQVADFMLKAVGRFGVMSTLIVSHGIWPPDDVMLKDMPLERWRNTMAVNLDGTFLFCRDYMKQLDQGLRSADVQQLRNVAIVLVGSTAGKFGEALHADYSCTKSAMMYGLTLSLKNEIVKIHPRGRVNTVSPGWIRTPMAARAMEDKSVLYQALASSPLKKVSEPEDVARAILFLASESMAGNITGISLDVNAGMEGRVLNEMGDF